MLSFLYNNFRCTASDYILYLGSKLIFQHRFIKIYKIAWCFKLKTDQKVLLFNYCLEDYGGCFWVKKIVKKRVLQD